MTEQIPSPVIEQVKRLRAAQAARETAELQRLVDAYAAINKAARADAEALALQIIASGQMPTAEQARKMSRYRELMDTVENELAEYQSFMRVELRGQSTLAITEGERDARLLASLSARGAGMDVQMRAINTEVIEQLVGFLDPRGPLYERLGMLGGWTSEQVSAKVLDSIAKGLNPRTTAAMLTARIGDAVTGALGMGLTDALRMMRTCQLWSYREANRASYLANADVVTGWIWYAELDGLTCGSCIAMHGSQHTLNETLNDHHNGRCTMLPVTIGEAPDLGLASGEEWFNTLNEEEQRAILGKGKFEAWKDGKFTLADLPTEKSDSVYGLMRTAKTLDELIQEKQSISFGGTHLGSQGSAFGNKIAIDRSTYERLDAAGKRNLVSHELAHNVVEDKISINPKEFEKAKRALLVKEIEHKEYTSFLFVGGETRINEAMVSAIANYVTGAENPAKGFMLAGRLMPGAWSQNQWDSAMDWAAHALKYAGTNKARFNATVTRLLRDLENVK